MQVLWDHMMEQLSCCGVRGYTDFPAQVIGRNDALAKCEAFLGNHLSLFKF